VTARLALPSSWAISPVIAGVLAHDDPRVPSREAGVATDAIHRAAAVIADRNPRGNPRVYVHNKLIMETNRGKTGCEHADGLMTTRPYRDIKVTLMSVLGGQGG
jgi:hypothetical protein